MKKYFAMTLALAMLMSTAATSANVGANESPVTATYVAGSDSPAIVYSVDIEWDSLDFTYYGESHATWNPDTHQYNSDYQAEGWAEGSSAGVAITNHSNTAVLADFKYTATAGYEAVAMNFKSSQVYMGSAADNNAATTGENTVTPTGKLPDTADNTTIGTITITIAKCEDVTERTCGEICGEIETYLASPTQVNDESEVAALASGTKYIMAADWQTMNALEQEFLYNYTSMTQAERNEAYYTLKAQWEEFQATKIHTKA